MIKKILLYVAVITTITLPALSNEKALITVNQFVSHPALDDSTKGIESALKSRGVMSKYEIKFANSHGSIANCSQISRHQAALNPKVMIAVATPSAQSNLKVLPEDSLLAFAAVTDPKSAGLDDKNNVIGVTDQPPLRELLVVMRKVLPNAKKIGIIYNHGETNSVNIIAKLEVLAKKMDLEIVKASISSLSDVPIAMNNLTEAVDVIYLPQDNMVFSTIDNITKISNKAKIPVITSVPSTVDNKVLLALGTDYFHDGEQLGNMIADYLEGKKNIGIVKPSGSELKINKAVAKYFGIVIPKDLQ